MSGKSEVTVSVFCDRQKIIEVLWTKKLGDNMRNIQRKNPQNVDVQNNSTQVLLRGFEDFWNLENETSDSEVSFRGSWVQRRNSEPIRKFSHEKRPKNRRKSDRK